jgi:hypothetical protein
MFNYEEYLLEQQQYLEQNIDIYQYHNPHPDNKDVGDCVKRAITICSGLEYQTVQKELNRYKKITNAKKFSENKNWLPYVEKVLKWKKLTGFNNLKVGEFAKTHPTGTYLISVRKHLTTVKDGKVLDTWNCSFKAINKIWQIN